MYVAGRRARRSNGLTREQAAIVGSQGRAGGQSQPRGDHAAENATNPTGIINSRTSPVKAGGRDCEAPALDNSNQVSWTIQQLYHMVQILPRLTPVLTIVFRPVLGDVGEFLLEL